MVLSKPYYPPCYHGVEVIDMSKVLQNLLYTESHEWLKVDGKLGRMGITDYAQEALTEIVNIDFVVDAGAVVKKGDAVAVLDSVKSSNEVYAPVSGKIVEINSGLKSALENINKDPYGSGWLVVIEITNPDETKQLLNAEQYTKLIQQ